MSKTIMTVATNVMLLTRTMWAIGLLAVRGALGEAEVSANDLVSAALRLRPDRISMS